MCSSIHHTTNAAPHLYDTPSESTLEEPLHLSPHRPLHAENSVIRVASGVDGVIFRIHNPLTNCTYAFKAFFDSTFYAAELRTHRILSQTPSLQGFIPTFHGTCRVPLKLRRLIGYRRGLCDWGIKMEFIEGTTLSERLSSLSTLECEAVTRRLRKTVGMMHEEGVMHGDICAENVMIRNARKEDEGGIEDRVVLIDFVKAQVRPEGGEREREFDLRCLNRMMGEE